MKVRLISLLALAALLNGCYYDKYDVLYPSAASCDTTNVSYSGTIAPIINTNCLTACHGDNVYQSFGGGYNLQGYTNFKNMATMNNSTLLINCINWAPGYDQMPNNGQKLSSCNILLIQTWINDGAKNN
jgi:hypothetical protein